jgi:zinc transport system permease protein
MYQLTFDEETAQVSGVPVRAISTVFVLLTGMTVAVTMPILGALLVSAMMVLPAALAIRIAKGFTMTIVVAIAVGLIGMWSGLTLSYYLGTPPGGSIALMLVVLLLVGLFAQTKLSTMKRGSTYL